MESDKGKIYGYARVSSTDQNLDRQIEQLQEYVPAENIITDKISGADINRPGYQALKGALGLRRGDTLVITSLDRLSRNKAQMQEEIRWFHDNEIRLKILDLPTSLVEVPEGQEWILEMINNILIEVLSSTATQERIIIKKRQREGIEAAKRKGKHLGRPRIDYPPGYENYYVRWKNGEITAVQMMKELGLSRSTFYRMVEAYEAKQCLKR